MGKKEVTTLLLRESMSKEKVNLLEEGSTFKKMPSED